MPDPAPAVVAPVAPGETTAARAVAEFMAARNALDDQICTALTALPAYGATPGWAALHSDGRAIRVMLLGVGRYTAGDLAPHQAALAAAGLRCKPRTLDGRPVLLVFPREEGI